MAIITGNDDNNVLVGTSLDDTILGYGGDDVLIGSGGNDILNGGTGADTMDGGIGNDIYIVDNFHDKVVEYANNGDDTIRASTNYSLGWAQNVENLVLTGSADIYGYGNTLDNHIYGNSGDNDLLGFDGNDYLSGGGGDDFLAGGTGNDTMLGGTGNDYFSVESNLDIVTEYANQGTDTVNASISYTLVANVENLVLSGSATSGYGNGLNNDITGNAQWNYLDGGAGADTMRGGDGSDIYIVDNAGDVVVELANQGFDSVDSSVSYTLGANVEEIFLTGSANINGSGNGLDNDLFGNSGNNLLFGFDGADSLEGGGGTDIMYGGDGNDDYTVDSADDVVIELANQGIDYVHTLGDTSYVLSANIENLQLDYDSHGNATGNALNNSIQGSNYDNIIDGGAGQDVMSGLDGNDTYYVDNALDLIVDGANMGNDTVFSTADYVLSSDELETLSLDIGNAVYGTGNYYDNTIFGNANDNVLDGSGGADSLSGLGGNDTFVFQAGQASGDIVYEFEGNGAGAGDMLQFSGYGTAAQGATFVQLTATDWQINSANGLIHETITLVGAPTVHASDFVFV